MRRRPTQTAVLTLCVFALLGNAANAGSSRPHAGRTGARAIGAATVLKATAERSSSARRQHRRAQREAKGTRLLTNVARTSSAARGLAAHARRARRSRTRAHAFSANRHVYCLGNPGFGPDGWRWDGTSNGWIRQYPYRLPGRVAFDNSVPVMQSVGCDTIGAEVRPSDPDPNGGTTHQRAQLYVTDAQLGKYGDQPALGDRRGQTTWYGFAFSTNRDYAPQTGLPSGAWGNWNLIFSWHDTPLAGVWAQANIQLVVATTGPANGATAVPCGAKYARLSQPRLSIELNGGNQDDPQWYVDDADNTCRRFFGPVFTPGRRYRVTMAVTWGDHGKGAVRVWIDGGAVVDQDRIDDMWYGRAGQADVFPVFENYRPYSPSLPVPDVVYYGGLIKGSSADDVQIP